MTDNATTASEARESLEKVSPVFLTATNIDSKKLNEWLLRIVDFGFKDGLAHSYWVPLTSTELPDAVYKASIPPFEISGPSDFAGKSIDDTRDFMVSHESQLLKIEALASLWLILDQEGLENMTALLVERVFDGSIGERGEHTNKWMGVRLKCEEAWIMEANLSVGNMGFEEFCDVDDDKKDGGMYEKRRADCIRESEAKAIEKLEAELQKLRDGGYIY